MRFAVSGLTLVAALGLAACANNQTRPTDTGNMAYPAPQRAGVIGTTSPGRDTGNMQYPNQPAADTGLRAQPESLGSTGSMQAPQSTQGNLRSRTQ
ncbi:MAG: hypothetical protein JOZ05_12715 [Acetobacteraceae bacterium]|nr:hypothetical protein [Acetobacteraceae bacterium]